MLAAIRGFWVKKSATTIFKSAEGQQLKQRLRELGIRPSQFAVLHKVHHTTITRYISGARRIDPEVWKTLKHLESFQAGSIYSQILAHILTFPIKMLKEKHVSQQARIELGIIPAKRRVTHAVSYPPSAAGKKL